MTVTLRRPSQEQTPATMLLPSGADERAGNAICVFALSLLTFALFSTSLAFVPANGDDLALLSTAAHTQNPLTYFVGDWGLGNNIYRPVHSISIWLVYRLFGVSSAPNQLINLCLHILVGYLLFRILYRVSDNRWLAGVLTAVALISQYTASAASWTSDRPTLLVAVFLLLLVDHLVTVDKDTQQANTPYVVTLSIFALLSKESGLIVPLLAIVAAIRSRSPIRIRWNTFFACAGVLFLYAVLRIAIFGPYATTYSEKGYLFGFMYYDDWARLASPLRQLAVADIVLKNMLAPVVPIFSNLGAVLSLGDLLKALPIWLPTILLIALSVRRSISRPQLYAIFILVFNAVAYFVEFRYRGLYLAQLAVCLFIAGSLRLRDRSKTRQVVMGGLATILLIFSVFSVSKMLTGTLVQGYEELNHYNLTRVIQGFETENQAKASAGIDGRIVQQVLDRYKVNSSP